MAIRFISISKVCKDCKIEKPLSEYSKEKGGGLKVRCKPCQKLRDKQWRNENKEYLAEYHRNYRKEFINKNNPPKPLICTKCETGLNDQNRLIIKQGKRIIKRFICRSCYNEYSRKLQEKTNSEEKKAKKRLYAKEYLAKNKELVYSKNKQYQKSEKGKLTKRLHYRKNIERIRKRQLDYFYKNREKLLERCRKYKGDVEKVTTGYAKRLIAKATRSDSKGVPEELVDLKRAQLKLHRAIKKYKNENTK